MNIAIHIHKPGLSTWECVQALTSSGKVSDVEVKVLHYQQLQDSQVPMHGGGN
jgi:hypothetical protein